MSEKYYNRGMQKILTSLLIIFLSFVTYSYKAEAQEVNEYVTTYQPAINSTTQVTFSGTLESIATNQNIKQIGFAFGSNENTVLLAECTIIENQSSWTWPSGLVRIGQTFSKQYNITNATPGSNYYVKACAKTETGLSYDGEIKTFVFPIGNETIALETRDVLEPTITDTSAQLRVLISSNAAIAQEVGFKIGLSETLLNESCSYIDDGPFAEGGTTDYEKQNLVPNAEYYVQACAKNINGDEFLGSIKSFTTDTELSNEDIQNQRNRACRIDHVEFLNENFTNPAMSPPDGALFGNYVDGAGREVYLKFHPVVASDCINVPIKTLQLLTTHVTNEGGNLEYDKDKPVKIIFASSTGGGERSFNDSGNFQIKLKAGDMSNHCKYIIGETEDICHVYVQTTYGFNSQNPVAILKTNIFKSQPGNSVLNNYTYYPNSNTKRFKGTLNYAKRSGSKQWDIWNTNDPTVATLTDPDFDESSPCYDPIEEDYDSDCYELLAPIPGLGTPQVVDGVETGRFSINSLDEFQLGEYVNTIFQVALGLIMVLAVIMIVIAGVEYMTIESMFGKSDAKNRIAGAVTGLILALGIFLILNTINPQLLNINFGSNIDTVSLKTVQLSQEQLDFASNIDTSDIQISNDVYTYEPLITYLYHQQGVGGAPSILWAAKRNLSVIPNKTPFISRGASVVNRNMANNIPGQSQVTPKEFLEFWYKRLKKKEQSIQNIPENHAQAIETASQQASVNVNTMKTVCMVESYDCTRANAVNNSYKGLFQMGPDEFRVHGPANGNIFNPLDNSIGGANLAKANKNVYLNNLNSINN